jgi:putative hemolysin
MLARELLRRRGKEISFKIGNNINYNGLRRYTEDTNLTNYLRWRTYVMGYKKKRIIKLPYAMNFSAPQRYKTIASPQSSDMCRQEIEKLPSVQKLVQSGSFIVWQALAKQIPYTLREIGRLREISFRLAGEGTGNSIDIDRFDAYYIHLFIWNEESGEIVGAYRLGQTDKILSEMGKKGLYTYTLFHSGMKFFNKLGPALEMGRSFIRPEYQKSYSSLLLLWKGIGTFITLHPEYRMLFGPVSISRDYSDLSRRLLATTLLRHSQAKDLSVLVRPRKPVRLKPIRISGCNHKDHDFQPHDFKEVCSVVSDIEIPQRDVPVLLRQYLNLGGQLLSFNIDKNFGRVMDGLILVDLLQTERRTLERFMGREGLNSFLSYHLTDKEKKFVFG